VSEVYIIGAGGHAKVVLDALKLEGRHTVKSLIDPSEAANIKSYPILNDWKNLPPSHFVVAIGDNGTRLRCFAELCQTGWKPVTIVHPHACIASDAILGLGTVVLAGAIINSASVVGANVIVNTAATIDHDSNISDHVHLGPGSHLGGGVEVGEGALIGLGANVIPYKKIGAWSIVAAGACVTSSIADKQKIAGVPARPI